MLGFVWTYNRIIPTKFFVTSGKAADPISSLNAFDAALAVELASSYAISTGIGVDPLRDFFAISREGGVDGAFLLTALSVPLISASVYSLSMIAVTALAITGPLGYQRSSSSRAPRKRLP